MKHKELKYKSNGLKEKEFVDVFILGDKLGKFKKGEIFEEFYTSGSRFYSVFSNLFDQNSKSGHTKIIKSSQTRHAPATFFKKIRKEDSMLWRLHHMGIDNLRPVEYQQKG